MYSCFFFYTGMSQPGKIDSLAGSNGFTSDTAKINRLTAASKQYWTKNYDSALYFAQRALQLSSILHYKTGIAESNRNIGVANMFHGDEKISQEHLLKALKLFSELSDQNGMAATYNNLGVLHTRAFEYPLSLKYFDSALTLFRNTSNKEGEGSVLNYIGINYQEQGNYQKAIDYCLQGFEIRKEINDHSGVVFSLINVGNMYLEVGQPQTALTFYNQSVSYAREHNMQPFTYSLNQIGKTYLKLKQYDTAETYLVRTVGGEKMVSDHLAAGELYTETGKLDGALAQFKTSLLQVGEGKSNPRALAFIGLSKVYTKKKEAGLAMSYARQAYAIADSLQNKLILSDVAGVLAGLYKANGDYKKALQFFELAQSVADSISGENYQRKLAFTESKNEIEKEQANVKLLSAEKKLEQQKLKDEQFLKKTILLALIIAIVLSFIIIRNINSKRRQIQSQKDQIELQKAATEQAYEELKSMQAQLVQREKMASLGELTAGIAHEIQNPLNFVNNFSDVNTELIEELQAELKVGNTQKAVTISNDIKTNEEKIMHHGKRADSIVKSMLQHSRVNTASKEPTDINTLAEEYLRLSYHGLKTKDKLLNTITPIAIATDFDESLGKINIIPQDIARVLLNIYNNAFYAVNFPARAKSETHTPAVSVATKKIKYLSGDGAEIVIKDNGNGIPPAIIEKIFQPFFTTKPAGQGTGLGLSLSYDIIKAHGGEIKAEAREGEGSTFIIRLPAV